MLKLWNKDTGGKHQLICKGKHIRIMSDFSAQILKARKAQNNTIQVLTENNCQPRTLHPPKLSFNLDREIRTFQDKEN
jgi:hypothetical protein